MTTQVTLLVNKNARSTDKYEPEDLLTALREVGYDPVCNETESEEELDEILANVEGLVIAAGGDGTMRTVAMRLVGRNVPLSLIPLGTANNIANTFGIKGTPIEIVRGLEAPRKRSFDIGRIRAPWGNHYFLEGAGYGFFADILALYDPEQGKSIFRGLTTFTKTLNNYGVYGGRLLLDDEDITDEYLMVEILNTKAVGPRLSLAPDADPNDGFFDVVCIHNKERVNFLRYITGLLTNGFEKLPNVRHYTGRQLTLDWEAFPIHIDAEVHPLDAEGKRMEPEKMQSGQVIFEVLPHALELWLPPGVKS